MILEIHKFGPEPNFSSKIDDFPPLHLNYESMPLCFGFVRLKIATKYDVIVFVGKQRTCSF